MLFIFLVITQIYSEEVPILNVSQSLCDFSYFGTWTSNQSNPFNYFQGLNGDSKMAFITNESSFYQKGDSYINKALLLFLDPRYLEGNVVEGVIDLENYDPITTQWSGESYFNYTTYYKYKAQERVIGQCKVNYDMRVEEPLNPESATISFSMVALDLDQCSISIQTTYGIDTTKYQLQVILYCLIANVTCAIQFLCVNRLCKNLLSNDFDNVQRLSIFTVGFVTIYDTYLSLQNLYFGLQNYIYFEYFIFPSLFYLILSTTCDLKLLWILWRQRYEIEFQDPILQRKYFARFFIIFYSSVIILFVLMKTLELYNWFLLLVAFFIAPQIIHNINIGINPKFIYEYIFGIILVNIALPLYFRGDPNNFRGLEPSFVFCFFWILLFMIQIVILYIQYIYGPRCIIPKCLLPKQYNYYQEYKPKEMEECAICLNNLALEPDQSEQELNSILLSKTLMITPCNHKFHPVCLKNWMDVKLQCPTCRQPIPVSNE